MLVKTRGLKLSSQQTCWLLLLIASVFSLDLITKHLTHLYLPHMSLSHPYYPYGGIPVFSNFLGIEFSITHNTNTGAAWGVFSKMQALLLLFRMGLVLALSIYVLFFNEKKAAAVPFILIITGAVGNIVDYFTYGHVVDMFHFILWGYDFPVFNIADAAIFLGVVWLCVNQLYSSLSQSSTSNTL